MPKILGLKLPGVLLAGLAFYFVGFIWYGVLFTEQWMQAYALKEADFEGQNGAPYLIGGLVISILTAIGIGLALKWRSARGVAGAIQTTLLLWVFFAIPFVHYTYLYEPEHSPLQLILDGGHLLVGWVVAAVVLSFFE